MVSSAFAYLARPAAVWRLATESVQSLCRSRFQKGTSLVLYQAFSLAWASRNFRSNWKFLAVAFSTSSENTLTGLALLLMASKTAQTSAFFGGLDTLSSGMRLIGMSRSLM